MLTLGPPEAEEQLRDTLAIGADRGILLATDGAEWDPQATAAAIVAAIEAEQAAGGDFDLIVFGNESADSGNYQVGIRVAHALGRPVVTGLKGLSVDGRRGARCEQEVAGGRDVYVVPAARGGDRARGHQPAALSRRCRRSCAPARSRSTGATPERPEPRLEKLRLVVPPGQGKQAEMLGEGPEAAPAVVGVMRELGVA